MYDFQKSRQNHFPDITEPTFFIALSLYKNDNYGYGILKDVEDMTDGVIVLKTATLYKALERLVLKNYIEETIISEQRHYKLTNLGREFFEYHFCRTKWRLNITENKLSQVKKMHNQTL